MSAWGWAATVAALIGLVSLALALWLRVPRTAKARVRNPLHRAFRIETAARLRAEDQRDFNEALMKSMNRYSQAMIYVKDLEGRYLMINEACERAFGLTEAEAVGQTADVVDPPMADYWRANDVLARSGFTRLEQRVDGTDGGRYLDISSFPVFDADGALYATCSIALDVTEPKRSIVELAEARDAALDAAASTSTFLATMSHEIRTPMNAVIGMTDLLMDTSLTREQQEYLRTVRMSGDTLLTVINDILDFSKIESGALGLNPTVFDLREQVEGCFDLVAAVASAKGLDLVSYVDAGCPRSVFGDAERIRQILVNLLSNAVKFTDTGEVLVTVSAATVEQRLQLTIEVTDTGIGISQEASLKLFRSFSQVQGSASRSYGGTGLGLVIAQRLAQAMDGDVKVSSTIGHGSTFTVTLMLEAAESQPTDDTGEDALAGVTVLAVDDNATSLRILDLQLSTFEMRVTTAATPALALKQVGQGAAFDVAVLDMHMPGMSGLELASVLQHMPATARTPILLLTSIGDHGVRVTENVSATLAKPVKSRALRTAIATALRPTGTSPGQHDGSPHLCSEPGGPGGNDEADDETATTEPPVHSPLRVLLAEDNLVNQRVAQLMLDKLHHTVDSVANGQQALEAIRQASYDVVLMDVQMPEMDGLEATRRIRAELPLERQPVIVAMTANAMVEDRQACTAAGMDDYLVKPVRMDDLRTALEAAAGDGERTDHGRPQVPLERMLEPEVTDVRLGANAPLPVDLFVIDRLREQLSDADDVAFGELVHTYILDGAVSVTELVAAVAGGAVAQVGRIAHSWRSSSALIGATTLAGLLEEAEESAQSAPADLPRIADRIVSEHARVAATLEPMTGAPRLQPDLEEH